MTAIDAVFESIQKSLKKGEEVRLVGFGTFLTTKRAATEGRNGKGCVVVFSAGNANRPVSGTINETQWPQNALSGPTKWLSGFAIHPDVLAISASTSLGTKAAYEQLG
ncbi:MAG: hypothetical protein HC839_04130 [Leptolyngbyaceae cyanobacterium RM2_2_21]|nr:hypothetical protein [Leptolyngbyaceae cyanobacterium RM2_2_21]